MACWASSRRRKQRKAGRTAWISASRHEAEGVPFAGRRWTPTMPHPRAGKAVSYRVVTDEAVFVPALFGGRGCRRGLRRCRVADGGSWLLCRLFRACRRRQAVRRVRRRFARASRGWVLSGGQWVLRERRCGAQDSKCHDQRFHNWRSYCLLMLPLAEPVSCCRRYLDVTPHLFCWAGEMGRCIASLKARLPEGVQRS